MVAISNTNRSKIKRYLEKFIDELVNEYKGRENCRATTRVR